MSEHARIDDRALFWRILHNDLRVHWRGNATRQAAWTTGLAARIGFLLLLHLFAWVLFSTYGAGTRGGPEFVCLTVLSMLAMSTLNRSLEVLYNRGDLTLLLASPVPPRVVLQTRLCAITLTSLLDTLSFVLPLLNVAIVVYGWQWAWGYAAWFAAVLATVPAALLTTIVAVERFGAPRARTILQVIGVLFGLAAFLAMQMPQFLRASASPGERASARSERRGQMLDWLEVPPLQQLAAAASGAWQWLLPLAFAGVVLFFLAQRSLALRFAHGAQGAAADVGGGAKDEMAARAAFRGSFVRSPARVLIRTQLLLLRRDPLLLMRCAMQIVMLVPMLLVAFMSKTAAGFGGLGLIAAAVVPMQLAALRNANDEGNEFEAASPLRPRERAWLRTMATAVPFVVFACAMAIATGFLAGVVPALMVAIGGTANAFASGWLGTCTTRVHTAEERSRNKQPRHTWQMLLGMLYGGLGAGGLGLAMSSHTLVGWILFVGALAAAAALLLVAPRPAVEGEA